MSPDKLVDENDPSMWVAKSKSGPGKIHEVILVKTEHWVQIYSNQKEINSSHIPILDIRASVKKRPPKLHNFTPILPLVLRLTDYYGM